MTKQCLGWLRRSGGALSMVWVGGAACACGSAEPPVQTASQEAQRQPSREDGVRLLGDDPLSTLGLFGKKKEKGRLENVSVAGQPFSKALRAITLEQPENPWELQLGTWLQTPVRRGDIILLEFYVRAISGQAESGEARTHVGMGTGGPAWSPSMGETIGISREWRRVDIPFVALHDTPVNGSIITFDMGFSPQAFEIGGLRLIDYGNSKTLADLPRTRTDYAGQESDAPWRKDALARIERLRTGTLGITVLDRGGNPVVGASVAVRMKRHAFRFGSAVAADLLLAPGPDADRYRKIVLSNYSAIVLENHLKWPFWETWARTDADRAVEWATQNGFPLSLGGPLIWGGWTNLPKDLKGNSHEPSKVWERITQNMSTEMRAYRGKVTEWEVINEPYAQNDLWKLFGYAKMEEAFVHARKADASARLLINDYPPLDGAAQADAHLNAYYGFVDNLLKAHAPLGGIGFQCHVGSGVIPPERLLSGLDRFSKFGLPISITEFDIDTKDEDLQRRYMRDFLTAAFSHRSVDAILMWGFWEAKHWLPDAALYRKDWSIKPSGQAWLDLVKRDWWTNADGATEADGRYSTRAFFGLYEVTAALPSGKTKTVYYSFDKAAGPLVIRLDDAHSKAPVWLSPE